MKYLFTNHIIKPTLKFMNRSNLGFFLNATFAKMILFIRKSKIKKYLKKYNVKEIRMGHFHIEYEDKKIWIKLFEAFTYKYKITKTKIWYIICDVHLGIWKYKKWELKPLINLIKAWKKIFILWDLTEWLVSIKKYSTYEKKVLNMIIKWIQEGNIFYIRWNHDNCALKKYWRNYMVVDNILLIHWDFLTNSFRPFCLLNE